MLIETGVRVIFFLGNSRATVIRISKQDSGSFLRAIQTTFFKHHYLLLKYPERLSLMKKNIYIVCMSLKNLLEPQILT